MANNQNIVETIKEEHPDFCCKNCIWAKNSRETLFHNTEYDCFTHSHPVNSTDFCSGFIAKEET